MGIFCTFGFHNWVGCKCSKCGKIRDEGHDWGPGVPKCIRCGKIRDLKHNTSATSNVSTTKNMPQTSVDVSSLNPQSAIDRKKRVITDPKVISEVQKLLVDPRQIVAIALATTNDEPQLRGDTIERFVFGVWSSINEACATALSGSSPPKTFLYTGPGTGPDARSEAAMDFVGEFHSQLPSDGRKECVFLQLSIGMPQYPPGVSGPKVFHLVTISLSDKLNKHEVRVVDKAVLIPEYDSAGNLLVELRPK